MLFEKTMAKIEPVKNILESQARHKVNFKTKPLGSLGILEDIAIRMALIQNSLNPVIHRKAMFVFAGDHGVAMEGVSAYPPEVTSQMVLNFLNGGAGINVLCRHNHIEINIIDMGVNYDFEPSGRLLDKKIRKGTRNFLFEDAMTYDEVIKAVESGMEVFIEEFEKSRPDIIGVGEMGIGNTTSASAIISAAAGLSPEDVTGRGTGIDDEHLNKKIALIKKALELRNPDRTSGLEILRKVGGYEIAGISGTILAAASEKVPVVLDGLISTAGGLIAYLMKHETADYLFAGHRSVERGQKAALDMMELIPILDLGMRLGEGTGASLAINIIEASCKILCEMASFEDAGVSRNL
jgi:nicotinate-nucleotide--dimethylbenzimidazole phosphoribosyltransferase